MENRVKFKSGLSTKKKTRQSISLVVRGKVGKEVKSRALKTLGRGFRIDFPLKPFFPPRNLVITMSEVPNLSLDALFSLAGKTVVVTGGGTGLGLMMSTAFVQNGAKGE